MASVMKYSIHVISLGSSCTFTPAALLTAAFHECFFETVSPFSGSFLASSSCFAFSKVCSLETFFLFFFFPILSSAPPILTCPKASSTAEASLSFSSTGFFFFFFSTASSWDISSLFRFPDPESPFSFAFPFFLSPASFLGLSDGRLLDPAAEPLPELLVGHRTVGGGRCDVFLPISNNGAVRLIRLNPPLEEVEGGRGLLRVEAGAAGLLSVLPGLLLGGGAGLLAEAGVPGALVVVGGGEVEAGGDEVDEAVKEEGVPPDQGFEVCGARGGGSRGGLDRRPRINQPQRALSNIHSTVSPSYTSAGLYVSGVRGSAQVVCPQLGPGSLANPTSENSFLYLRSSKLGSRRPGARPSHVPHHSPHRVNRGMRQGPRITEPLVTVIKATISAIRPTGGNHDHRNSAEITAPNPAGISITPQRDWRLVQLTRGNHDHRNSAEVTAPNPAGISITPQRDWRLVQLTPSECLPAEPTRRALQVRSEGREQLRTSAKRASKGFIDLVVSAPYDEKRLNGHLGWSRAMILEFKLPNTLISRCHEVYPGKKGKWPDPPCYRGGETRRDTSGVAAGRSDALRNAVASAVVIPDVDQTGPVGL
ncbi:hypothetical protein Taro_014230 [Colocasia esculenta]|uniref:Uncharacterized protein n=1 Tax=Colocasia esculenta TaxID=4460 RepID=A0A843UIA6_COLES|nr:hypothetical protein [Colocasia esculenta]